MSRTKSAGLNVEPQDFASPRSIPPCRDAKLASPRSRKILRLYVVGPNKKRGPQTSFLNSSITFVTLLRELQQEVRARKTFRHDLS